MGRVMCWWAIVLALLLSSAAYSQDPPDHHVWVPIKLYRGYLIVAEGSIGRLQHRHLLIDTAAYPSAIDEELVKDLRLTVSSDDVHVIGGDLASSSALLPELQIGPVEAHALRVEAQDLRPLGRKIGTRIDALIGLDVLSQSNFRIDYEGRQLVFGQVGVLGASVPLKNVDSMAYVDIEVNGQPLHLLMASAASRITVFDSHLASLDNSGRKESASMNLAGKLHSQQFRADRIKLGRVGIGVSEVRVTSAPAPNVPFDGLLAIGSLGFGQVAFDFDHQMFAWQPASGFSNARHPAAADESASPRLPPFDGGNGTAQSARCDSSMPGEARVCPNGVLMPPSR
jgi:hypothetical protein